MSSPRGLRPEELMGFDTSDPYFVPYISKYLVDLSANDVEGYGALLRILAEAVANDKASRAAAADRVQDGKCLLDIVLERLDPSTDSLLVSCQSLRFVGNCCIENEANCEIALQYIMSVVDGLGYPELISVATGCLYNMCVTSEEVTRFAGGEYLYEVILNRLYHNYLPYKFLHAKVPPGKSAMTRDLDGILADGRRYLFDVVGMIMQSALANENLFTRPTKWFDQLFSLLIEALGKISMEVAEPLIDIHIAYAEELPNEDIVHGVTALMTVLLRMEQSDVIYLKGRATKKPQEGMAGDEDAKNDENDDDDDDDEAEAYQRCCRKVSVALTTLSGKDNFPSVFGFPNSKKNSANKVETPAEESAVESKRFKTLVTMLTVSAEDSEARKAACLMLGNIAITDTASLELVNKHGLHKHAIAMIRNPRSDRELRHSAAGLLSNLAHPHDAALMQTLLEANYLDACAVLIDVNASKKDADAQLRYSGLNLLYLIIKNSIGVSRILLDIPDDGTPKEKNVNKSKNVESPQPPITIKAVTNLVAGLDPTNPIDLQQIEQGARIVCAVARSLVGVFTEEQHQHLKKCTPEMALFLKDENVLTPLIWSLRHTTTPNEQQGQGVAVLREVFFTFALIAFSEEGARVVYDRLGPRGTAVEALQIARKVFALGRVEQPLVPGASKPAKRPPPEDASAKALRLDWCKWGFCLGKYFLNNAIHVPVGFLKHVNAPPEDVELIKRDEKTLVECLYVAMGSLADGNPHKAIDELLWVNELSAAYGFKFEDNYFAGFTTT